MKIKPLVSLLILSASLSSYSSSAQDGTCHIVSGVTPKTYEVVVKSSTANLSQFALTGITATQFHDAVASAVSILNEQSSTINFKYGGTTSASDADCNAPFSVVTANSGPDNFRTLDRCGGDQFTISMPAFTSGGALRNLTIDYSGSANDFDFIRSLMHEMLHGAGLHHTWGSNVLDECTPGNNPEGCECSATSECQSGQTCGSGETTGICGEHESAIVGGINEKQHNRRDLYYYDIKCLEEKVGRRQSITGYRRWVTGGSIGAESSFTSAIHSVSAGITKIGTSWYWAASYNTSAGYFTRDLNTSNTQSVSLSDYNPELALGMSISVWKDDDEDETHIIYPEPEESTNYSWTADHLVHHSYSDDGFAGSDSHSALRFCSSASCRFTSQVRSAHRISSYTLNNSDNSTIFAWVNENRSNDSSHGEILISAGTVGSTLEQPFNTGIFGLSSPGIACRENGTSDGKDCILTYVDLKRSSFRILARKFSVSNTGPGRYSISNFDTLDQFITASNSPNVPRKTSAPISMFWHNNSFYIVYKSLESNQPSKVLKSTDGGATWTYDKYIGYTVEAPSVVTSTHGNNAIVYGK